jgi:DNA replication ATP-dependent helicase Dna2
MGEQNHLITNTDHLESLTHFKSRVFYTESDLASGRGCVEERVNLSFQNLGEAHIVGIILSAIVAAGCDPSTIGVISPYKPQIAQISEMLGGPDSLIEVSTVDRFQGRDKHCIVISLVRSNLENHIGSILGDWHRLNVAFTRARCKLVLVGSWSTIMGNPTLKPLRELFLSHHSWILKLPPDAFNHRLV